MNYILYDCLYCFIIFECYHFCGLKLLTLQCYVKGYTLVFLAEMEKGQFRKELKDSAKLLGKGDFVLLTWNFHFENFHKQGLKANLNFFFLFKLLFCVKFFFFFHQKFYHHNLTDTFHHFFLSQLCIICSLYLYVLFIRIVQLNHHSILCYCVSLVYM